jgi:predicted nucleotidyltransferase
VARDVLNEECAARRHLVVYLSGAHAYGFPSPDSDLDLKAVHLEPTRALVGMEQPRTHANRFEIIDGVEIDYSCNELGPVLAGIVGGNGNYLERVLGDLCVLSSLEHQALKPLVRGALSRRVFRHYAGFARNQYTAAFHAGKPPTAKKVLYVLRTALTGTHLLRTGELVIDVRQLLEPYGLGEASELVENKQASERTELSVEQGERWNQALERVMAGLDQARDQSCLPEEPEQVAALEDWLLEMRRSFW